MNQRSQTRVLFVCMGNICRSPTGEGVFRHLVSEAGVDGHFLIDSAGTHAYHIGDPPDPRSQAKAAEYGIDLSAQRARRVSEADFRTFDHILAMDSDNMRSLERIRPDDATAVVSLLLSHGPDNGYTDVPDPYYGGARGFELVYQLIHDACTSLLEKLSASHRQG